MAERLDALLAILLLTTLVGAPSCKADEDPSEASSLPADGGGSAPADGGGGTGPTPSGGDAAAENDAGTQSPPGTGIALPRDAFLLTDAKPLNIDTVTEVVVSRSLKYMTAYEQSGPSSEAEKWRFLARSHATSEEVPGGGVKVWWRTISQTGEADSYICRKGRDVSGEIRYSLTLEQNAGKEAEPDVGYRDQCSWTLWKHPTEDTYAIRAPKGASTAESGMVVTKQHATAYEAYQIRVDGSYLDEAPYFRMKSAM